MSENGRMQGELYLQKVSTYLRTHPLPLTANGTVSIAALADAVGVPTQSLHKNPRIRAELERAAAAQGVRFWSDAAKTPAADIDAGGDVAQETEAGTQRKLRSLEREIKTLAQQNALLVTENAELRRRLHDLQLQLNRVDYMMETGRRVAAPPAPPKEAT
jgi:hypothetical protein